MSQIDQINSGKIEIKSVGYERHNTKISVDF